MKILEKPKTIISNPDSVFGYFAWPTIARLKDGNLACSCSGFRIRHICPFGKAVISYSRDEGKTWTHPSVVIDTPLDDRDSGLCVSNDKVIMTSFNNTPAEQKNWVERSVARGDTSPSLNLWRGYLSVVKDDAVEKYYGSTYKISYDGGYTFGELRKSPVTSPHGPFVANDGRIIWVGKTFSIREKENGIALAEMDENENFVIKTVLPDLPDKYENCLPCEPHAVQLKDGTIIVEIRVQKDGLFTILQSESYDNGVSFTVPHQIIPDLAGSPPHLLIHSSGKVVLTYACRHENYGIKAIISDDGCKTFSPEITLTGNALSPDLGYPASVEREDGSIITVYYEKEENFAVIKQVIWEL